MTAVATCQRLPEGSSIEHNTKSDIEREQNLNNPNSSLRSAAKWSYIGAWIRQILTAINSIIVAAIVGPDAFGLVAMALLVIAFAELALDQGYGVALIQRDKLTDVDINSVFWMNLGLSLLLTVVSIVGGYFWAIFCKEPEVFSLVLALSLSIPLTALSSVPQALIQRDMDYKSMTLRTSLGALVGGILGVGSAFVGMREWSLVIQYVSTAVFSFFILFALTSWRPSRAFSFDSLKSLSHFAAGVFLGRIAFFLNRRAEVLVCGVFLGPVVVGILRFADRLVNMCLDTAARPIQAPFLRYIAVLQTDSERSAAILRTIRFSSIVTSPILLLMAGSADTIPIVLGEKWLEAVWAVRLLSIVGAMQAVTLFTGPVLTALGKPYELSVMLWGVSGVRIVAMLGTSFYVVNAPVLQQVTAIALVQVAVSAIVFLPWCILRLIATKLLTLKDFFIAIIPGLASGMIGGTAAQLTFTTTKTHIPPVLQVAFVGVAGVLGALIGLHLLSSEFRSMINKIIDRRTRGSKVISNAVAIQKDFDA